MSITEIKKEDYSVYVPYPIHAYIVQDFKFHLQCEILPEQLLYYCHESTGAVFLGGKKEIFYPIIEEENIIPFTVATNINVLNILNKPYYTRYKGIFEDQLSYLYRFIKSDYFNADQKKKLKEFLI